MLSTTWRVCLSSLFWRRIKVSQTTFRVIFGDDKRKAVLVLNTFLKRRRKEKRFDTRLSQKRVSVEMKLFWNAFLFFFFLNLRPTHVKACALHDLCSTGQTAQCSCAVTRPSSRLVLAIEFDAITRERRFERRLHTGFDNGYWNVFLLLGKMINTAEKA